MTTSVNSVRAFTRPLVIGAASLLVLLAAFVLAPVAAAQSDESVAITTTLEPVQLEIDAGTTITWTNDDGQRHRVRSIDGPEAFDSGNMAPGESFSHTFTREGSYPYYDHRDRDDAAYFGTIVVGSDASADGPLPERGEVSIVDRSFRPASFSVAIGGSIAWTNDDGEAHTVTSTDGVFDSGILDAGATFEQTFGEAGTFSYSCLIHPEMRGTVSVSESSAGPTLAAPLATVAATEAPADRPSTETDPAPSIVPMASPDVGAGIVPTISPAAVVSPGPLPVASVDTSGGPAIEAAVSIIDRSFQPSQIEVHLGDAVMWSNDDGEGHTVTAVDGDFNSGVLTVGDEFSTVFETPGSYDYFCAIHPGMTGTVTVIGLTG
jgi:plastocyanin